MAVAAFVSTLSQKACQTEAVTSPLQLSAANDLGEEELRRLVAASNLQHLLTAPATLYALYSHIIRQEVTAKQPTLNVCDSLDVELVDPRLDVDGLSGAYEQVMRRTWPRILPSFFQNEFEPLEFLGKGAFGEVWRCRCREDQKEYAVKAVHYSASAANGGRLERRVIREAQTWASMSDHPNIVTCHRAWVEVEGGDTSERESPPATESETAVPASTMVPRFVVADSPVALPLTRSARIVRDDSTFLPSSDSEDTAGSSIVFENPSEEGLVPGDAQVDLEIAQTDVASPRDRQPAESKHREEHKATLYIQMQLGSMDTLQTWISRRNAAVGRLGGISCGEAWRWASEACDIFFQCVAALAHLHQHYCAHRDIKPSNILFSEDGSVLLADFGLAKYVDESQVASCHAMAGLCSAPGGARQNPWSTRAGVGTPSYASPEQLIGGAYGIETDIFALGMLSAELLCPIQTQMERAALFDDLRNGRRLPDSVEAAFPTTANLLVAMTSPKPDLRPTANELLDISSELLREVRCHFGSDNSLDGVASPDKGVAVHGHFVCGLEGVMDSDSDNTTVASGAVAVGGAVAFNPGVPLSIPPACVWAKNVQGCGDSR